MENSNKFLTFLAFLFLYSCINQNAVLNKGVECRLYWVGDSYPLNTQNADMNDYRMISLHYIIGELLFTYQKQRSHRRLYLLFKNDCFY